jgi:hypothetical protein
MPKTSFNPAIDGFGFGNGWHYSDQDGDHLASTFGNAVASAIGPITEPFADALGIVGTGITWVVTRAVLGLAMRIFEDLGFSPAYGMCGGMAFAALDYHKKNWVVPRGYTSDSTEPFPQPDASTPEGAALRDYIWTRLNDSLTLNASTFLTKILVHQLLPFNTGNKMLFSETKTEWEKIKQHLDRGEPWPVGLVGSSANPMKSHQVLAIDYRDAGDQKPSLIIYDNNVPGKSSRLDLDFSGEILGASYEYAAQWMPLKALFCEEYAPKTPPIAIGLERGMVLLHPGPYHVGDKATMAFMARNSGFGRQPYVRLAVFGGPSMMPTQIVPRSIDGPAHSHDEPPGLNSGGSLNKEAAPFILQTGKAKDGGDRIWAGPAGNWKFWPMCDVGRPHEESWKLIPIHDQGTVDQIEIDVDTPRWTAAQRITTRGGWGDETAEIDIAVADLSGTGQNDLVVFRIDDPQGANSGYIHIGRNLDQNGIVSGGWSAPVKIPLDFGSQSEGAGIAITHLNFKDETDILLFRIDNPEGQNLGSYAVGRKLQKDGHAGWGYWRDVPGPFGEHNAGAGIAVARLPGHGSCLIVFFIDNPTGENRAYYRIGWDLDEDGVVKGGWSPWIEFPGWWGEEAQGAGIAAGDMTGSGDVDLVIFNIDHPTTGNRGYFRVAWALGADGRPTKGFGVVPEVTPGFYGNESQGAGVGYTDLNRNLRPDLVFLNLDNPHGANAGWYWSRIV